MLYSTTTTRYIYSQPHKIVRQQKCGRRTIPNYSTVTTLIVATTTSSSAIAERPRYARVTSIRKIAKWNF